MTRPLVFDIEESRLRYLADAPSLLAFDIDGTLSELVDNPGEAVVTSSTSEMLTWLAQRWPVAVITGRCVHDAARMLGFTPRLLFGNHGAEMQGAGIDSVLIAQVDSWCDVLTRHRSTLDDLGILIENKRLSLALHYRRAPDPTAAKRWLDDYLPKFEGAVLEHGHGMLNVTSQLAPDKGAALQNAIHACAAKYAIYVGDDKNDEAAFRAVKRPGVSIVIGDGDSPSAAEFFLRNQQQVERLLERLWRLRS